MPPPPPDADVLMQHAGFVRAIARGLLGGDSARADDVVQESLLAALRRPPRGDLRAWLGAVARRLSLMARRGDGRRDKRERRAARPESLPSTAEAVERLELQRLIVERVLKLPEPYRTTLIQRYLYELEVKEIARRLGVPEDTVRTRIRRGLLRLREDLDGRRSGWMALLWPAAAPAAPRTWIPGALLMSTKTKIAVASLAVLLTLFLGWRVFSRTDKQAPARSQAGRSAPPENEVGKASPASAPSALRRGKPPVDFATVDRDRDVHGVVVDPAGKPVAGAELQAYRYPWAHVNSLAPRDKDATAGPQTTSAGDGTFRLRLGRGDWVGLRARARGFAEVEQRVLAGERVRIALASAVSVRVVVRDDAGAPLEGARASVFLFGIDRELALTTGADGVARFDGLSGGAKVSLQANHPLRAGRQGDQLVLPPSGSLEHVIELAPGRLFSGVVTDTRTGSPIADASVGKTFLMRPAGRTDENGRYRINGWMGPQWHHPLYVFARGYAPGYRAAGANRRVDFALEKGVTVSGRVVAAGGEPVPGARVGVLAEKDRALVSRAYATTDDSGRFRLEDLNGGLPHLLAVTAPGHGRIILDFDPQQRDLGDIALTAPLSIEGVLLDPDGKPYARTGVAIIGENGDRMQRRIGERGAGPSHYGRQENRNTDDLGRFRFPNLSPGSYTLHFGGGGRPGKSHKVQLVDADLRDVRLVLPRGRAYVVTVVDDQGAPVERASIHLVHEGGQSTGLTDAAGRLEARVTGTVKSILVPWVSPGDRAYGPVERIDGPPAQEARVVVPLWATITGRVIDDKGRAVPRAIIEIRTGDGRIHRAVSMRGGTFRAVVPPGSTADVSALAKKGLLRGEIKRVAAGSADVELRLAPLRQDRTLRVRVVAPGGDPVEGAHVVATGPDARRALTGADGRVELRGLPESELGLMVLIPAGRPLLGPPMQKVVPRGQEIVITCLKGVLVEGRATLPDGKPAAMARITFLIGRERYTTVSDATGAFSRAVPEAPGEVTAAIFDAGGVKFHAPRQSYDPAAGPIEIRLKPIG